MPVIRGQSNVVELNESRRAALLTQLENELQRSSEQGPVIFEIPLPQSAKFDVLVVWEEFEALRAEDRTGLILAAYADRQENLAQALGVTYGEAMEQNLLPYAVVPITRRGEADPGELRQAMLAEGAITTSNGKVDLRFPAMSLAKEAHQRLCDRLPAGYWSIVPSVGPIA